MEIKEMTAKETFLYLFGKSCQELIEEEERRFKRMLKYGLESGCQALMVLTIKDEGE
jgi:hypothetical protein